MPKDLFAIAIGASTGGVEALLKIAESLPAKFPAIVLVTQHIGNYASLLPELMRASGPNHAMHPDDGDRPLPGTIYVAPPDCHLMLERDCLRLFRGPKENYTRPAIDPMFRSVAMSMRSRAIGIVLTGHLDDGTVGLKAIKHCGGVAIVQDPATAREPSMPRSALANVDVDLCLPLAEIVPAVQRIIAGGPRQAVPDAPIDALNHEQLVHDGSQPMENLAAIADPSMLTCPDCGGGLWEIKDGKPLRYRCHTGHAFTAQTLAHAQTETAEFAMWAGVRALHEKEVLLRRLARVAHSHGDHAQAEAGERQADDTRAQAADLVKMIERKERGA
ncbi:MAG TPA: chemotaxis protein CheB [Ramlibacter sp.]|nr:chemotaxis protein CheB [Ramlibacter sp.]